MPDQKPSFQEHLWKVVEDLPELAKMVNKEGESIDLEHLDDLETKNSEPKEKDLTSVKEGLGELAELVNESGQKAELEEMRQLVLDNRMEGGHFELVRGLISEPERVKALSLVIDNARKKETDVRHVALEYMSELASIKEFDPEWFKKNQGDYAHREFEIKQAVEASRGMPIKLLEFLYDIKVVDRGLWQEIQPTLGEEFWAAIAKELNGGGPKNDYFLNLYYKAAFLDYGQISQRVVLEDYWQEVKDNIEARNTAADALAYAKLISIAQQLKPEGEKLVVFDQRRMGSVLEHLSEYLNNYERHHSLPHLQSFFRQAANIKYLQVNKTENRPNGKS